MSATATGLIERAQRALLDLQRTAAQVTHEQWSSFDQTVYRLLHELVRTRTGWQLADARALALHRAASNYPRPLQPADNSPDFSVRQAAQFLGLTDSVIRSRVHQGVILAAHTETGYRIPRSELSLGEAPLPASSTDSHPLAKLGVTVGCLTDLLVLNRMDPSLPELDAASAGWIGREILGITEAAARTAFSLSDPAAADRPLSIARYARHALAGFPVCQPPRGLQDPGVSPPPPTAETDAALLSSATHQWALLARRELEQQVPSVEVLKDVNRQAIHIYAALDVTLANLNATDGALDQSRAKLRTSAYLLQAGVEAWSQATTGVPPSREYVEAARLLYRELSNLTSASRRCSDPEVTYQALLRGANDVARTITLATPQAARLIASEVLFVHARHARSDARRLSASLNGRLVVACLNDTPELSRRAWEAERSTVEVLRVLPASISTARQPTALALEIEM